MRAAATGGPAGVVRRRVGTRGAVGLLGFALLDPVSDRVDHRADEHQHQDGADDEGDDRHEHLEVEREESDPHDERDDRAGHGVDLVGDLDERLGPLRELGHSLARLQNPALDLVLRLLRHLCHDSSMCTDGACTCYLYHIKIFFS